MAEEPSRVLQEVAVCIIDHYHAFRGADVFIYIPYLFDCGIPIVNLFPGLRCSASIFVPY